MADDRPGTPASPLSGIAPIGGTWNHRPKGLPKSKKISFDFISQYCCHFIFENLYFSLLIETFPSSFCFKRFIYDYGLIFQFPFLFLSFILLGSRR
jgi:hypothetical protein